MTKKYALRTCNKNLQSHRGFQWPESGLVEAPDWDPKSKCEGGLYGFLNGEGAGSLVSWADDAKWLVVEIEEYIDLGNKIKFPRGNVIYCGNRHEATDLIRKLCPQATRVIGATVEVPGGGTATAGERGTATAGERGTATAGERGTATAGERGTATAGKYGTATAGEYGTATAGEYGNATAGERGTATAEEYGTATAGDGGNATAGERGIATAGVKAILQFHWHDQLRRRCTVAYVGEDGILPNVPYRCNNGKVVKT